MQRGHKFDARGKGQCPFVHRVEFAYGLSPSSRVSKFEARDTHLKGSNSNSARLLARPLAYSAPPDVSNVDPELGRPIPSITVELIHLRRQAIPYTHGDTRSRKSQHSLTIVLWDWIRLRALATTRASPRKKGKFP